MTDDPKIIEQSFADLNGMVDSTSRWHSGGVANPYTDQASTWIYGPVEHGMQSGPCIAADVPLAVAPLVRAAKESFETLEEIMDDVQRFVEAAKAGEVAELDNQQLGRFNRARDLIAFVRAGRY